MTAPTMVARLINEMRETEKLMLQKLSLHQNVLEETLHLERLREQYLREETRCPNVPSPSLTRHVDRGVIL